MSNRVSLRQLRAFHAVMIGGSLSAAAGRLNLTLPSVSKQLSALERELGIELFERRRGKVVTPTRMGIEFFKSIESTISGLNDLSHIEFALGMLPTSNPDLKSLPLVETRAVAVMAHNHPLAKRETLNPDDVRDQSLILQSRRLLRERIDAVLQQQGYDLPHALESSSAFTCCRMVSFGLGIAICDPFSPTSIESSSLVVREWEPEVKLSYGMLMPRAVEIDATAETLLELIKAQFFEAGTSL